MSEYYNAPLFAAVVSWVTAQVIKTFFYVLKHKSFNRERILGAGGMPSSHSATVSSLAMVISRISGVNSVEFALAMVLAFIVMYDASGVRRAAGMHAKEINRLRHIISEHDNLTENDDDNIKYKDENQNDVEVKIKELKEFLGHTPVEVVCGAILGIIIGMIVSV